MFQCIPVMCGIMAMYFVDLTSMALNLRGIFTFKNWFLTWVCGAGMLSLAWVCFWYLWTYGYQLRFPFPYQVYLPLLLYVPIAIITVLQLPRAWFKIPVFRKRVGYLFVLLLLTIIVLLTHVQFNELFTKFKNNYYQSVFAVLLPAIREVLCGILSKIGEI